MFPARQVVPFGSMGGGGTVLAAGHSINVIIENNRRHVNVAAAGMNKMIAADGGGITITHGNDELGVQVVGQF